MIQTCDLPERMLSLRYASINESDRSIGATIATENPCAIYNPREGVIDEILLAGGAILPRQCPLLDSHDRGSIRAILGSTKSLQSQNGEVTGRLFFAEGDPESDKAWSLVRTGHLTDISAGYVVIESELIRPREEITIQGRLYRAAGRKLRIATKWELREASLVAIGADQASKIQRSNQTLLTRSYFPMPYAQETFSNRTSITNAILHRGGIEIAPRLAYEAERFRNYSLTELCREALIEARIQPEADYRTIVRQAVESAPIAELFTSAIKTAVYRGFVEAEDPTAGWCSEVNIKNFKQNERAILRGVDQLEMVPRGGTAEHAQIDLSLVESYRARRFGKQFVITEQDILDDNFQAFVQVPLALGAAAKMLRPDLVFSILLENADLADGLPLFHTDRNNAFAHALAADKVGILAAAMAGQYRTGIDESKILLNVRGKYLVVSEALRFTAAAIARNVETAAGNTNVIVQSDGRIDIGVRNPETGQNYDGSSTAWFVASGNRPAIEVGYRQENRMPSVRQYNLEQGQWGIGWDIKFDIGAKAIDPSGIARGNV